MWCAHFLLLTSIVLPAVSTPPPWYNLISELEVAIDALVDEWQGSEIEYFKQRFIEAASTTHQMVVTPLTSLSAMLISEQDLVRIFPDLKALSSVSVPAIL